MTTLAAPFRRSTAMISWAAVWSSMKRVLRAKAVEEAGAPVGVLAEEDAAPTAADGEGPLLILHGASLPFVFKLRKRTGAMPLRLSAGSTGRPNSRGCRGRRGRLPHARPVLSYSCIFQAKSPL